MLRDRQKLWRRLNLLGDLLLTYGALLIAKQIFSPGFDQTTTILIFLFTLLIWSISLYGPSGSYFYRMKSPRHILKELYWALTKAFPAFVAAVYFIGIDVSPVMMVVFFAVDIVLLTMSRMTLIVILNLYRSRGRSNRNVIIIGTGPKAKEITDRILGNPAWGIRILGFLDYHRTGLWRYRDFPLAGHPDGLPSMIIKNQVDFVIIAVENGDLPLTGHAFAVAEEMGVTVCLMSDLYFHPISRCSSTSFMDFPAVVYSSVSDDRIQLALKKAIDWAGALIGLILSLPISLAAAVAIKLEDGGPIFFRQVRAGRNGRPFTMLKFRTRTGFQDEK
jgi:hypothetical protein